MAVDAPSVARRRRRWRPVFAWIAGAVFLVIAAGAAILLWVYAGADVSTAGRLTFENPLRIPELLEGERGDDGVVRTTVRLLVPFGDHTDPQTPYMFHCHKLRHEDRGMMGQFVVVAPGQTAGTPPSGHDHG